MLKECGARFVGGRGAERDDLPLTGQNSVEETLLTPGERRRVTDARINAKILISRCAGL